MSILGNCTGQVCREGLNVATQERSNEIRSEKLPLLRNGVTISLKIRYF